MSDMRPQTRMPRRGILTALGTALVLSAVAACTTPPPRLDYTPVPDDELKGQLEAVPGVEGVQLVVEDNVTNGHHYYATLTVAASTTWAESVTQVDQAVAVLWQGRPLTPHISVQFGPQATPTFLASSEQVFGTEQARELEAAYADRYGPRPGTGKPPATPLTVPSP